MVNKKTPDLYESKKGVKYGVLFYRKTQVWIMRNNSQTKLINLINTLNCLNYSEYIFFAVKT